MTPASDLRTWVELRWPTPPVPGTTQITPLSSLADQLSEGLEMNNCVGSDRYLLQVVSGKGYGYHVQSPHGTATAWIAPSPRPRAQYTLSELEGPGNTKAHPQARRLVQTWLRRHNVHKCASGTKAPIERVRAIPHWVNELAFEEIPF